MADTTIEWATKVWNFVRGCRRVSPGCGGATGQGGCYAEAIAGRFSGPGLPYEGLATIGKNGARWTGKGRFVSDKIAEPMGWRPPKDGSRHRVFVNSMSDLFFEEFSNEEIAAGFAVMAASPQHDFLILTKRADRMRDWFRWVDSFGGLGKYIRSLRPGQSSVAPLFDAVARTEVYRGRRGRSSDDPWCSIFNAASFNIWPLDNVWLGVSAEDQQRADERIPLLLQTPAAVRFVSAEPLLGPIRLDEITLPDELAAAARLSVARINALTTSDDEHVYNDHAALDWVIVGGESGRGARPFDLAWGRSIIQQCKAAGVPAFFKQAGAQPVISGFESGGRDYSGPLKLRDRKGGDLAELPEDLRVREFPEARR